MGRSLTDVPATVWRGHEFSRHGISAQDIIALKQLAAALSVPEYKHVRHGVPPSACAPDNTGPADLYAV